MDDLLLLQQNVQRLTEGYIALKQENEMLKKSVEEQKQENARMYLNINNLRKQNKQLQVASALLGDATHRDSLKQQLRSIIQKLDRSLSVLKM